jgi:hypothetical protein
MCQTRVCWFPPYFITHLLLWYPAHISSPTSLLIWTESSYFNHFLLLSSLFKIGVTSRGRHCGTDQFFFSKLLMHFSDHSTSTFNVSIFSFIVVFSAVWVPLWDSGSWNVGSRSTIWRVLHLKGAKWHKSIVPTDLCTAPWAIVQLPVSYMHLYVIFFTSFLRTLHFHMHFCNFFVSISLH